MNQGLFLQFSEPLGATQAYKPNDYDLLVVSVQPGGPETRKERNSMSYRPQIWTAIKSLRIP